MSEYEIVIRPKPITEFDSTEDLQRYIERCRERELDWHRRARQYPTYEEIKAAQRELGLRARNAQVRE